MKFEIFFYENHPPTRHIKYKVIAPSNKTIMANKTSRINAKPWMFRLPFKVYGAVIT